MDGRKSNGGAKKEKVPAESKCLRANDTEAHDDDDEDWAAEQEIGEIGARVSFPSVDPKNDRRKLIDTTTPTLVDETSEDDDEEEQEMITLETERLRRLSKQKEEDLMPKSAPLRRTPGAHAMHQSSTNVLGFGLALSTPIGNKTSSKSENESLSALRRSPSAKPPRNSKLSREASSYTPASFALSKNPHLEVNRGAFSPNTLRLTEDLDNLLDEEESSEHEDKPQQTELPFPSKNQPVELEEEQDLAESWTSSYIFQAEGGTGTRKPKTRNNRGNNARRSRNQESPRSFRTLGETENQKPLNFGGAFAPLSGFQRPVPSQQPTSLKPQMQGTGNVTIPQHTLNAHSFAPHDPRAVARAHVGSPFYRGQVGHPDIRVVQPPPSHHHHQYIQHGWTHSGDVIQQVPSVSPRPTHWNGPPYGMQMLNQPLSPTPRMACPQPFVSYPSIWQGQDVLVQYFAPPSLLPSEEHQFFDAEHGVPGSKNHGGPQLRNAGNNDEPTSRRKERKPTKQPKKNQQARKNDKNRKEAAKKSGVQPGKKGAKGKKTDPEDPSDAKRAELVESPATRAAFKEFYRNFRNKERSSFKEAEQFALNVLNGDSLPAKVHWRVYLELADLAKRSNRFEEARKLYTQVCELQPYASQGWLEYSKLEEECGHMKRCAKILNEGLQHCDLSENLLTRAIKHEEKMGNLTRARELLARLKHVGIEKVWRTVLEGALLEGRAGNHLMARRVLKYLMHHVPWYGPLYLEAYKLERDMGRPTEALDVVEKGLKTIPRYGPLWFGAFRLCESLDLAQNAFHLPRTTKMFERASNNISRELIWKVHLEAAQILERAALSASEYRLEATSGSQFTITLEACRKRVAMTVLSCPQNLLWKVWLAGGRIELSAGNVDRARTLIGRAHKIVPDKGRVATMLESARLEEFVGEVHLARAILLKSRMKFKSEWKVWLESVLLEIRSGETLRAIDLAKQALEHHSGTGRLWAALVQLRYSDGEELAQYSSLRNALRAVPKSGEVWCEGGRIHLNPMARIFDLQEARRHLQFATRFTPQYGDSFLETLRLEAIEKCILPTVSFIWEAMLPLSPNADDLHSWISSFVENAAAILAAVRSGAPLDVVDKSIVPSLRAQLDDASFDETLDTSVLELRCANADPNYGLLWFHCRHAPTDTARVVLKRARRLIVADLKRHIHLYVAAIVRRFALIAYVNAVTGGNASRQQIQQSAITAPSIDSILKSTDDKVTDLSLVGSDFTTGLVKVNRHVPLNEMTSIQRKKALFGSDALFS